MLTADQREALGMAASRYSWALLSGDMAPEVKAYLNNRGLSDSTLSRFLIGVVENPEPEHENFEGMVSIPYMTKLGGIAAMKFRRAHDCEPLNCEHQKYLTPHETRIFNAPAIDAAEECGYLAFTEGEVDAMTLDGECDIPAVGVPGVDVWGKHPEWPCLFEGIPLLLGFFDNDEAGEKLKRRMMSQLPQLRPVTVPLKDVNKSFLAVGREGIRKAAGIA